jgi:hypothetical protein
MKAVFNLCCFLYVCLSLLTDFVHANGHKIQGVILTTGKDTRAFEKSIVSALKYLIDVDKYYIITPSAKDLDTRLGKELGPRVVFVDESVFPFNWQNISEVMIETVRQRGVYPLTGKSQFEGTVYGRTGWFLQQLLKFYAGRVLNIGDYVLLDSDIIWFRNVSLVNETKTITEADGVVKKVTKFNYATSSQYHAPYMASLKRISGMEIYEAPDKIHRSGIVHHMVIAKPVLEDLFESSEKRYGGLPFWKVLLNERYGKVLWMNVALFTTQE